MANKKEDAKKTMPEVKTIEELVEWASKLKPEERNKDFATQILAATERLVGV